MLEPVVMRADLVKAAKRNRWTLSASDGAVFHAISGQGRHEVRAVFARERIGDGSQPIEVRLFVDGRECRGSGVRAMWWLRNF